MKCEQCGGSLKLEDVVCPYCEAVNPHAIQHIREMKRYKKEFEGTKEEVITTTRKYAGITTRVIIIAVLVILIVICGVLGGEAYSIRRKAIERQSVKHAEERKEVMEEYLEERQYYAFHVYCDENIIRSGTEGFEEYNCIFRMTSYYSYIYDSTMRVMRPYDGADVSGDIENISTCVNDFYKLYDDKTYAGIGDSEKNLEVAKGVEEQIKALLVAYCGVSKEDADALSGMSDAQRALIIEEGMMHD